MRTFILVAFVTLALVAQSFAAPTCGCDDDDEKVVSYEGANKSKESKYANGECSADKVDVSSTNNGIKTQYGSDKQASDFASGEHQECGNQVSIKGDQGSTYDAKQSSTHTKTQEGSNKSENSYFSSKPDDCTC